MLILRCFFIYVCFFVEFCFASKDVRALADDWIVVLGTGGLHGALYKKEIFKTLGQANAHLLLCASADSPLAHELRHEGLVREVLTVSPENETEAFQDIKKHCKNREIRAFFTVREDWLSLASALAKAWNLPYQNPEAFRLAQNKEETRKRLVTSGLKSVPYTVLTQRDLEAKKRPFEAPFFIKPRDGIRSEFVRRIESGEEWECYIRDIQGKTPQSFLAEEEIVGHEVDVDMFLKDGKVLYAAVSDNFPCHRPFSLETGQLSPSMLPSSVQQETEEYAAKAAKALGFREGNLHVEVMIQPDGAPVLIEINGRLGGMYIPFWHQDIWGVDLIRAQLALASGEDPKPFLQKKTPYKARAQLCVTSNTDGPLLLQEGDQVLGWKNRQIIQQMKHVESATLWDPFPFTIHPKANGHPNLGEVTASGKSPREALHNLLTCCVTEPPILQTSRGDITSSLWPLRSFAS
jgi:biotin carboxylase